MINVFTTTMSEVNDSLGINSTQIYNILYLNYVYITAENLKRVQQNTFNDFPFSNTRKNLLRPKCLLQLIFVFC